MSDAPASRDVERAGLAGDAERAGFTGGRTFLRTLLRRVTDALAAVPLVVWAATALLGALLLAYSLLYPTYIAPDEPQHVDMVLAWQHHPFHWPGPAERPLSRGVAASSDPFYARGPTRRVGPYLASEATPRSQRRSLKELGGDTPTATPPRYPNQIVQHPPLYYAVEAVVVTAVPGSVHWSYDEFVWFLRLVSALMVLPVPVLAWATTRRAVGLDGPAARAAAFVPLTVPGFTHIGAVVNNDNLLVPLCGIVAFLSVPIAFGDFSRSRAVKVGAVLGLAILTKALAFIFIPVVLAAYAFGWWRARSRRPVVPAAIALAAAFVVGGWWFARNKIVYGHLQPNGFGDAVVRQVLRGYTKPTGHVASVWWHRYWPNMQSRFWGSIGLLEPPSLPRWLWHGMSVLLVVLLLVALARGARSRPARRDVVALLIAPLVLLFASIGWETYHEIASHGNPGGMQGRYLYATLVPTAAAVGIAIGKRDGRVSRFAPVAVLIVAASMQAEALRIVVSSFWLEQPARGSQLHKLHLAWGAISHWSPLGSFLTAVPFVLVPLMFVAALAIGVLTGVPSRRHDSPPERPARGLSPPRVPAVR